MTAIERETIINFNDGEATVSIYTAMPAMIRKLDKLCENFPAEYKCVRRSNDGAEYECSSRKLISFRGKRELTDEQKEMCREHIKKAHEARKAQNAI